MNYIVLDTCSILHILRGKKIGQKINEYIEKLESPVIVISAVTKAELNSIIVKSGWGMPRSKILDDFLTSVTCIDIVNTDHDLMDAYVHIDSYSQGKNIDKRGAKLVGSAKNMGKNDIWIASTAYVLNCPLVTSDRDFDHLHHNIMQIVKFSDD